jgi:[ribosomal protein S5]-alanine N-acetyltransferase
MTVPPAFLVGERIYLRPLQIEDIEGPYINWFNDEEVCRGNSHHILPHSIEDIREYIATSHKNMQEHLILAIISKNDDTHIGNIALQNIHPVVRSAELSIIIGEKSYWGQGFGKEAFRLICDHGFRAMNISRISCGTFETNTGMIKIAQYIGMKNEGRRRNAAFKEGKFLDIIEFGILKDEYEQIWFAKKGIQNEQK